MATGEWQRVLRGVVAVGEELARLHSASLLHRSVRKLPGAAAEIGRGVVGAVSAADWPTCSPPAGPPPASPSSSPPPPPQAATQAARHSATPVGGAASADSSSGGGDDVGLPQVAQGAEAVAKQWAALATHHVLPSPPPAAAPPSPPPPRPVPTMDNPVRSSKAFNERKVPASPIARAVGFGSMAAGMVLGTAGDALRRTFGGGGGAGTADSPAPSLLVSEANATRLAEGLCRMRGAGMKLAQMLSLADESVLPPSVTAALERVRQQADIMPRSQLDGLMVEELGPDWRTKFAEFSDHPMAAASIGQVHRATLHDGREAAVKVQYPGVADSIESDLLNLERLLTLGSVFPKGLYIENILEVAREELRDEVDYVREAAKQREFRAALGTTHEFLHVPDTVDDLCTRRVLTTELVAGVPLDQVVALPQEVRDHVSRLLLTLTMRELFEFQLVQSDPNPSNFLYDATTGRLAVIDFGAAQNYSTEFMADYLQLVWSAAQRDVATLEDVSLRMGFLTGDETAEMKQAHVEAGLTVGEPFVSDAPFDFHSSGIVQRVSSHGEVFASQRLTPPPKESYSIHRRLSGCFLACIRLKARIPCRDILIHYHQLFLDAHGDRVVE